MLTPTNQRAPKIIHSVQLHFFHRDLDEGCNRYGPQPGHSYLTREKPDGRNEAHTVMLVFFLASQFGHKVRPIHDQIKSWTVLL